MKEMGVLDALVRSNEAHFADSGGFVSPMGISYVGASKEKLGRAACAAVKRIHLDARMVQAAQKAGAELTEEFDVDDAVFDAEKGIWTVSSAAAEGGGGKAAAANKVVRARVLVIADGATSRLATKLGYCTEPPRGVCTRAFVEAGTHNANFDGVCFYPKWSLPGYAGEFFLLFVFALCFFGSAAARTNNARSSFGVYNVFAHAPSKTKIDQPILSTIQNKNKTKTTAIFRHPNDELNFCYYLIPCGANKSSGQCGTVDEADLARLHSEAIARDPYISAALGPRAKIERMRAASLRMGSQGVRATRGDHLLVVGDAAGHIDPLTGEGIHTAMMGGKAAAGAIADMAARGDFSRRSARQYEREWMRLFGHDFFWSRAFAEAIYRCPLLLDAVASETRRRGDAMMATWAEVMTCLRPKTHLLRPDVGLPLAAAVLRELFEQKVLGKPDRYALLPAPAAAAAPPAATATVAVAPAAAAGGGKAAKR